MRQSAKDKVTLIGAGVTLHACIAAADTLALKKKEFEAFELRVQLRPRRAGSDVLDLGIYGDGDEPLANVVVDPIKDRHGRSILTVRDQNTFSEKRLMDLIHVWLIHRFKAEIVYYVTPTEDNIYQTEKMKSHGLFSDVYQEVGEIIVADVNQPRIDELLAPDREALKRLIAKED